jgi:murein DD-endopeptidase MepM/ murein hydrolase activator NlpD
MLIKMKKLLVFSAVLAVSLMAGFYALGQSLDLLDYGETAKVNREIKKINSDIQNRKSEIKRIQDKQEMYSEVIKQKQQEKSSLSNQLAILDNRVAKAELDIELAATELERVKLEKKKTDQEIADTNQLVEEEKTKISSILRIVNKKDNTTSLEILLLNDSFSEFMNQLKYLEDMNTSIKDSLDSLKELKRLLDRNLVELEKKNTELTRMKENLEAKKDALEAEKESKLNIIAQLTSSEIEYQRLLDQSRKEQQNAAYEIADMEKRAREKLASLEGSKIQLNDNGLIWPVVKNVVTAYFHDPDYPFKAIFEHPAIDIRAAQGSTLRAAASGYVARVKDGGATGYSYIMLVHANGLSTVYGHVSKFSVKEDEYVAQGQVIGKTGGLPGTPGAGSLTTGPHLHFEVRLNGIPVDPLNYLP